MLSNSVPVGSALRSPQGSTGANARLRETELSRIFKGSKDILGQSKQATLAQIATQSGTDPAKRGEFTE